jgi:hypothetical protein
MPMILRFGLLMELASSCIFLSQLLSCLTKISSVFLLFLFYLWALRFYLLLASLLEWSFTVIFVLLWGLLISRISVWFFFLRFSKSVINSSFIFCVALFNSCISLFISSFVSLWCLLRSSLSSLICFYVISCSLFLVPWNFLSASCTFWLTMSNIFSMNFSEISSQISSLRVFCGHCYVP